jgi:pseudouridine-5'-phosphate glycosidase
MRAELQRYLRIAPSVANALACGEAVVALESTIVTHGMPWPANLETARAVEMIVRAQGATPATIAILDGQIVVGLDDAELERLAQATHVHKVSRADIAHAVVRGGLGATTVAATMLCAHLAGIAVFATGGIGGVHRGAESTFDISADLDEFTRTPLTVVCAGAKALLDLPKTLEALETRGVPVVGYGTDDLPAFWSRSCGLRVPLRLDTPDDVAALMRAQSELVPGNGLLVTNPIPVEAEIPHEEISEHIDAALLLARDNGISGKAVTPFLLERILASTAGRSLQANVALIKDNARVAAQIARAFVLLQKGQQTSE